MQLFGQICCAAFAAFGLYMALRTVLLARSPARVRVVLELPAHTTAADVPLLVGSVRAACPFFKGPIEVQLAHELIGNTELLAALYRAEVKILQ